MAPIAIPSPLPPPDAAEPVALPERRKAMARVFLKHPNLLGPKAHIPVEQEPDGTWGLHPPSLHPQALPRMIIQPDFLTHWKVQALSGAIGRLEAITTLLTLWGHCQTTKACVHRFSPEKLAGICQYHGDPDHLLKTFLKLELLDPLESGEFEVHGWAEKNSAFTKNWENGGKGGRPSKPANKNPNPVSGNPNPVSGNPNAALGDPEESEGRKGRKGRKARKGIEGIECLEGKNAPRGGSLPASISWNIDFGWSGFTPEIRASLAKAFPSRDFDVACNESDAWLRQKPAQASNKNWFSFLTNWLRRSSPSGDRSAMVCGLHCHLPQPGGQRLGRTAPRHPARTQRRPLRPLLG